jgi:hypothetical protein
MDSSNSDDSISRRSSCFSQSGSDRSDTSPSSASSRSSDWRRTNHAPPAVESHPISRWEIVVPYSRVRQAPTDITVDLTENRFVGDPSRDRNIAAPSHVQAIENLTNLLNNLVPNGDEPRDSDLLTFVRNAIRTSGRFQGLAVGQKDAVGVNDDQTAFRLTVDVDTPV